MSREHPTRGLRDYAGTAERPEPLLRLRLPGLDHGAVRSGEITVTAIELRGASRYRFEVCARWRGEPPHGAPPEAGPARLTNVTDTAYFDDLELARHVAHLAHDELAKAQIPDLSRLALRAAIARK